MKWKAKSLFLLLVSVPAFSGYPVNCWNSEIISGLRYGWVIYFVAANLSVWLVTGSAFFTGILSAAALITLPVVFGGATISYLFFLADVAKGLNQTTYSAHYVSLCLTMLTVIPLAIAMIALIPFQSFEKALLTREKGVSKTEKFILMFLRVFNHILFWVIPTILEVIREERPFESEKTHSETAKDGWVLLNVFDRFRLRLKVILTVATYVSVEGISAAIQYVPLWASEISLLPDKNATHPGRNICQNNQK